MDLKRLRTLYNRCNPDEPLAPTDPRNVDIDRHGVRGMNWTNKLARQIELANRPVFQLFSGLRGSGKSTELQRLAARLSDPQRSNLVTVLIDGDDVLDLTVEIDVSDVLALVLIHAERAVIGAEGGDANDAGKDGAVKRLWTWLSTTDVELGKVGVGVDGPLKLSADLNLKTNPTFRQQARERVARHLTSFVRFVKDELAELDWRARKLGRAGLVVIFDSLEKLRGTSLTWKPVLDSAERVFAGGAPYLQLPVHALYTIPPALTRRMTDPVSFLPMIKVRDRRGVPNAEGVAIITELVERRIAADALVEIFGQDAFHKRVRAIALWSGGYPREIVRLLQTVLEAEHFPVDAEALERELRRASNTYRGIVHDSGAMAWLAGVNRTKKLVMGTDQEREAADLFLQNNVILRYLNDDEWVDVHPAVAGMEELAVDPAPSSPVGSSAP